MTYPRVLIIGETFHSRAGGGITLYNLFNDWPVENIGVITDRISETDPLSRYSYYRLGWEEIKFPFPFSIIQTYVRSGQYYFNTKSESYGLTKIDKSFWNKFKKIFHAYFDKILEISGMSSRFYSINLSSSLKKWICEFKPDIIYIQPFLTKIMVFGNKLYEELEIPYGIHIMDDSVRYNNRSILFRYKHQNYLEGQLKQLIKNASVHLCISEAMAVEYNKRYGVSFLHFRNPIDINKWLPFQKKNLSCNDQYLKIIYTGRLYSPTFFSLVDMCKVVDKLNKQNKCVELDIYSHDQHDKFKIETKELYGVNVCKPVHVEEMPPLVQKYDIFFLCLDFDKKAQNYSKFSISTRTSEGMISGVPVLVYAPVSSAISNYFIKNKAGLVVTEQDQSQLLCAIIKLWTEISIRQEVSKNAIRTAMSDSNSVIIRENFRKTLSAYK